MPLTCECDYDPEPGQKFFWEPNGYTTLPGPRRKRCVSCNDLIDVGATVARFTRFKVSETDLEYQIHGDEVPLAPHYHCERCADLFFSLSDLGYCVLHDEDMRDLVEEYAETKKEEAEWLTS